MIIFSNIIGFDGLIFILAAINIFVFLAAKKSADDLYKNMHRSIYAPSLVNDNRSMMGSVSDLTDQKVSELRENAVSKYTIFTTIIAIFPLMGILGTVISLLGMVGDAADMQDQFLGALTSTFWGLVFAITFKGIDGIFISSKLEDGEHAADLFMQRKIDNSYDYNDGYMPSANYYNADRYRNNNRNYKGGRKNNSGSTRSYTDTANDRQNRGNDPAEQTNDSNTDALPFSADNDEAPNARRKNGGENSQAGQPQAAVSSRRINADGNLSAGQTLSANSSRRQNAGESSSAGPSQAASYARRQNAGENSSAGQPQAASFARRQNAGENLTSGLTQDTGMPYRAETPEASGIYSDEARSPKKKFEDMPSFDELYKKKKKS